MNFSLTNPEPLASNNGRDPNVFPPQPGINYGEVAVTRWLEAQHLALDLDDLDAEIAALRERLDNATVWFQRNGKEHPKYERHYQLRWELDNRMRALLIQYRHVASLCWTSCMYVYAALQHIDRAAWVRENARGRFDGETPQGVWRALRPNDQPPGAWPPQESEAWVERHLRHTETWYADDLLTRLHERLIDR